MKKYNEMNSSEDSFNVEDLSFQVEEEALKSKINNIDNDSYKSHFEKYDKFKKKLFNVNNLSNDNDDEEKGKSEKRSLWGVFYDKFIRKSIQNGTTPIIEDIEFRIFTLMNSNNMQGVFCTNTENQIKNFSSKNHPITDLRKYINQISIVENIEGKPIQNKVNKQSSFLTNNKKLLKKKTLIDLLPNCDISKLLNNPSETNKSPGGKITTTNMTTNMTINNKTELDSLRRKNSNYVEIGKNMNILSPVGDKPYKVTSTPRKSLTFSTNNNIIHNLEVKKNINDMSTTNDKLELTEKNRTFNIQDKKPEKFKFILNKEEREVLKLISNNKYSYEIEFESYEHLLRQNNMTKKIVQNMDFKFLENVIILNADKNINEKLYEKSARLKNFQIKTNTIISRFLKKNDNKFKS